ncbi:MAG: ATP-dependent DNA helicase RecG [Lachnospiraceae bacterium]|nr:ATP-dependent DNA helicase RecG [Lachnospiraceae bacterium]
MNTDSPITSIKGIGDKTAKIYEKLGVYRLNDMLLFFPRDYCLYPEAVDISVVDREAVFAVRVKVNRRVELKKVRTGVIACALFAGGLECVWFNGNYIPNVLHLGYEYVLYGKVTFTGMTPKMSQPAIYTPDKYAKIEGLPRPVYHLTKGISNNVLTKNMEEAVACVDSTFEFMPREILDEYGLYDIKSAYSGIHFPKDFDDLKAARDRIVFDEFFLFNLSMRLSGCAEERKHNIYAMPEKSYVDELKEKLPFRLTGAQESALNDILDDLNGEYISNRLIQGDVGSGKTIVALLSMLYVTESGYQAALMAPTEVLAEQHYESINEFLDKFGVEREVVLLTGSTKKKKDIYAKIKDDPGLIIVGTHALITEAVEYNHLALVITDEQHRFGVRQREALAAKGETPHNIVMSATPIPRSLAVVLYAGMDISVINELPADRLPIKNCVVDNGYRPAAYNFIRNEVKAGHQAYVICPLVEASEDSDGKNVEDEAEELRKNLPGVRIEYLHGQMKPVEKNDIMTRFAAGEIDILVSTTVIEVGINVPNATVMMIENAEKFGLATLHQLRGRVGRGKSQSYCIFFNLSGKPQTNERLEVLRQSNDGFKIAEEDLKQRGPGDFFGIRQSGDFGFKMADIYQDSTMLLKADQAAGRLISEDPDLTAHPKLLRYLQSVYDPGDIIL